MRSLEVRMKELGDWELGLGFWLSALGLQLVAWSVQLYLYLLWAFAFRLLDLSLQTELTCSTN
jgi:hypothetical protein